MARPKTTRKAAARIARKSEGRIVELSLQNPDFGARRLVTLLEREKIRPSTSQIYTILKRHDLQTRAKRLAKLDARLSKKGQAAPRRAPAKITPSIQARIVEVSLQNPDYGGRRLAALLAAEGVSVSASAIYSLLKRHGLQTRALRFSRIELQHLTDAAPPDVETVGPYAVPIPAAPDMPEPAWAATTDTPEAPPLAPAPRAAVKPPLRVRWLFYLADLCLLALIGYLGYLGYHTVLNFKQARLQAGAAADVMPEPVEHVAQPITAAEPFKGYNTIWERNLFNIPDASPAARETEIPIEKIALAQKNIGLQLLGTVVANDANYSRAIVHVSKTREQGAYREGEQAGDAKIKRILRNKVVIATAEGDQLLTIDDEDFGQGGSAGSTERRAPMSLTSGQPYAGEFRFGGDAGVQLPRRRARSINLKLEEVAASLADTGQLLKELTISPFMQDNQPAGFIIGKIPRGSILTKMGLRNGYAVTQVNDIAITGPEQALDFFRTLAEGGEVTIEVNRSRGTRRRPRQINLNIE